MRLLLGLALLLSPTLLSAQTLDSLPDAPVPSEQLLTAQLPAPQPPVPEILLAEASAESSSSAGPQHFGFSGTYALDQTPTASQHGDARPTPSGDVDRNGNPIPLERQQPKRILGLMPNFRSVSGGAAAHPPGWKYNFTVATHQAFDYSSFLFLGLTSISAEGIDSHPALGKGVDGFYAYTWRGFLDKTDGTYLSAWFLASALHEDTRYYALGGGHTVPTRIFYILSRQAVARTYGGRQTPNIAGLGGKVLTQIISRTYYPTSATSFSTLATKFGYSVMRDVSFSSVREFYPDIAAHYIRKHREKMLRQSEK